MIQTLLVSIAKRETLDYIANRRIIPQFVDEVIDLKNKNFFNRAQAQYLVNCLSENLWKKVYLLKIN